MFRKSFSLFLSLRYLRPKRSAVSVITVISIAGVTIGVTALTVIIAVMTGFNIQMRESILGFEPHLVMNQTDGKPMSDWYELVDALVEEPGVVDVEGMAKGQVVLDFNRRVWVVEVHGVDPVPGVFADRYEELISNGTGEFDLGDDNVIIGSTLAGGMGITVGDTVSLLSLANGRELLDSFNDGRKPENLIQPAELTVVGIYDSGWSYDDTVVFVPMEIAQFLYDTLGQVDEVNVLVEDPFHLEEIQADLAGRYPELQVLSWKERNKKLFDALRTERVMMFFLLFMLVIVAAFCIMNTMITVTTQKRREIGIMKAVGARTGQIAGVFLGQGIYVGIAGTLIGLLAAILILTIRKPIIEGIAFVTRQDLYSSSIYTLYSAPAEITIVDLVFISGGTFFACALASVLPAYLASRMDAALALRNQTAQ